MTDKLTDFSKIESLKSQPLNIMIYENLKAAIIRGDILPKTKLTETGVAKQMNVSATPVREAFRQLSAEGLIKIVPWKGAVVQEYSEEEIKESYQCREVLELLAIRLAIQNIDDEGISRLENLLDKTKQVKTPTEIVQLNSEIHDIIIGYSGNKKLKQLLDSVSDVILHDRNITAYNSERLKNIHSEHSDIVNALKERDLLKAEAAMKNHLENAFKYIIQQKKMGT